MAWILLRDSVAGHALRSVCKWSILEYPEDQTQFLFTDQYRHLVDTQTEGLKDEEKFERPALSLSKQENSADTPKEDVESATSSDPKNKPEDRPPNLRDTITNNHLGNNIEVSWYGEHDPQNPKNWPWHIKLWTLFIIYLYCFSVYMGASIATPTEPLLQQEFGISTQLSSLVLSIYVLGYGLGPMFWGPLSEMPVLGRNAPYVPTMAVFVVLCIPGALVNDVAGVMVIRFLQGFFGSPVLSIAAGSQTDMLLPRHLVYGLVFFQAVCFMSPGTGPAISAFVVTSKSWRWAFWELMAISGLTLILMLFTLPETNPDAILLHRARRIRKITGDERFRSQSEMAQAHFDFRRRLRDTLLVPFKLTFLDAAVAYANVYVSLNYAIYYSFFESFPLVYEGIYGFSPQITSVMFTAILVGAVIAVILYLIYLEVRFKPRMGSGKFEKEEFLLPTLVGGLWAPVGLGIFAWTARTSIHWIVPTIGVVIYCAANYNIFRGVLTYVIFTHPKYAASITASNGLLRAALAAGAIHFSQPLFEELGIARGVTILMGLTFGCWLFAFPLWRYGARLRERSTFAD